MSFATLALTALLAGAVPGNNQPNTTQQPRRSPRPAGAWPMPASTDEARALAVRDRARRTRTCHGEPGARGPSAGKITGSESRRVGVGSPGSVHGGGRGAWIVLNEIRSEKGNGNSRR